MEREISARRVQMPWQMASLRLMLASAIVCTVALFVDSQRVALLQTDEEPSVAIADLVRQNPLWAPETQEPVSQGFNSWMNTLPFSESDRHRQFRYLVSPSLFFRCGESGRSVCTPRTVLYGDVRCVHETDWRL